MQYHFIAEFDAQERDQQYEACRRLWSEVMRVGLVDASREFKDRGRLNHWLFTSHRNDVGSLLWLCELFDLDEDKVRSMARSQFRKLAKTDIPKENEDARDETTT